MTDAIKMKKAMKMLLQSWSNLPVDIINYIMEPLGYVDLIRCRVVCKSWRSNISRIIHRGKLPWAISFTGQKKENNASTTTTTTSISICHLYDPFQKRKYTIENKGEEWEIFSNARVRASKHGWVLLSKEGGLHNTLFFFYAPFTNKIIKLPELDVLLPSATTFFMTPDSSDCVIFVLDESGGRICVSTCSPGDKTWRMCWIDGCYGSVFDLVHVDGVFYCAFLYGVGVFKVEEQEWEMKIHPYPLEFGVGSLYLFESHDGNVLLSYSLDDSFHRVFRFDPSEMSWVDIKSLDDRSLFLGHPTTISIRAVGETSKLANTIHFDGLRSFKCLKFPKGYQCPKVYDWVELDRRAFWIQPPDF